MDSQKSDAGMREYLIVTAHPQLPPQIKAQGPSVGEAWKKTAMRGKLVTIARKIDELVVRRFGGEILTDGAGYGIEGSPDQFNDMIRVVTTPRGVEALKAIPEVGRISEAIDFDHLLPNATGTNVPPGVCWTRPEPACPQKKMGRR
jgi:hypothetical protein